MPWPLGGATPSPDLPDDVSFEVVRSNRRTITMQVKSSTRVVVRAPKRMSDRKVTAFVEKHRAWLDDQLARAAQRERELGDVVKLTPQELRDLAEQARRRIPERVAHFAPVVGVGYGRITIRAQKTRWGSCSAKGNLNFNCLLMLTPPEVLDYVVVHELCHRRHMNHSPAFWAEVERVLPNYKQQKRWFKENGSRLMARVRD